MAGRLRTSLNNGLNNGLRQSISGGVASGGGGGGGDTGVVSTGLYLHLDAGDSSSYSGSGTTWLDLTSNDLDFTLTNGPAYNSGFSGYFAFDGSNDFASLSSGWSSFGTDPFTIEVWYRPHTSAEFESILGTNGSGAGTFQVDFNSSGNIRFLESTSNNVASTIPFGADTWKQVVFVREGTSTDEFKIYLNGSLNTTDTRSTDFDSTNQIQLGRNKGNSKYYDGDLSIVRIYKNKALSSSEVTQNFDANKGRYSL